MKQNVPEASKICLCRPTSENYPRKVRFDVSIKGIILIRVYIVSAFEKVDFNETIPGECPHKPDGSDARQVSVKWNCF